MKLSPHAAQRPAARSSHGASPDGWRHEGNANSDSSHSWKGWTNGGGERVSTAAQFSRFADHDISTAGSTAVPLPFGAARTTTAPQSAPVPSSAPQFPADPSALTAPISAAIDRLSLRGQDQMALTVRFEQGGSLSLKLAMRDGQIATQIQTDVPGLEQALRSAWSSLTDDLSGRGLKLAAPSFTPTSTSAEHDSRSRDGHTFERRLSEDGSSALFPGRGLRSSGVSSQGNTAATREVAPRSGGRSSHALQTWA